MRHDIEALKAGINIIDVIRPNVSKVIKSGNITKVCCPFHDEKTPSMVIYDDHYHCFGCGAHGDAIKFLVEYEGLSFLDAVKKLGGGDFKLTERDQKQISEREEEYKQQRMAAVAMARKRWEAAKPATPENAYLMRKMVEPHMARIDGKALLVPVYDTNGEIQNVQTISADGGKLFQWGIHLKDADGAPLYNDDGSPKRGAGAPAKGGRLNFGICLGRSIVCEGFATGASIYEAVPDRVVVAFSKGGMFDIIRELHGHGQKVAIASDRNALPEMLKLGQELGVPVYAPIEPYDDFNDMAVGLADGDPNYKKAIRAIFDGEPIHAPKLAELKPKSEAVNDDDDSDPVDIWAQSEAPELPEGLLPEIFSRAAYQASELSGADPGGYAMGMICAAGAAIPDTIKIKVKVKEDWTEEARTWVMLLGEPSYKKSPIMKTCTRALAKMDAQLVGEYEREYNDWAEHKEGDPPLPRRMRIDDITMEAAQEVARYNPQGVLAMQDELSGWFGGIEKYAGGKGSAKDRSFWLRAFGGGSYAVNRISRKPFLIENLSISVLGGIQPDAIRRVMADATDDGLIQRFYPVVLRPSKLERDDISDEAVKEYDALIERLARMKPPKNFYGDQPLIFDEAAQKYRDQLHERHHNLVSMTENINKKLAAHFGKYDGMFPRLCVIWHCVENANLEELPQVVTLDTAQKAGRFLHEYIMRHSQCFYNTVIGLTDDQDVLEDVAGYILAHKVETVTMRTFQRGSTKMRKLTRQQVEPLCHQLEAMGWLDSIDMRGARMSCSVNPRVHEIYRERAEAERERRDEIKAHIKEVTQQKPRRKAG